MFYFLIVFILFQVACVSLGVFVCCDYTLYLVCYIFRTHGHQCCYTANCNPEELAKRRERTQFRRALLEKDYNIEIISMQRCKWDRLKQRKEVREFLEKKIWLPNNNTRQLNETELLHLIQSEKVFGFVQCDVQVPDHLKAEFADLPPVFKNANITIDDVGETMQQYARESGDLTQPRRSLISSYHATQQLFSTNLLQWYISHGLQVTNITLFVQFRGDRVLSHLPDVVAGARLDADLTTTADGTKDFAKVLVGEMMKLVGNSYYGKTITNIKRHMKVQFIEESKMQRALESALFNDQFPVGQSEDLFEVISKKEKLQFTMCHWVGFQVRRKLLYSYV